MVLVSVLQNKREEKSMKLIVCIADNNGILFNNRRVSRDVVLCENVMQLLGEKTLYLDEYSAKLFEGYEGQICIRELKRGVIEEDAYYFFERGDLSELGEEIAECILYRWNRDYPADTFLDMKGEGFELIEQLEFAGKSHNRITREIWKRN